MSTVEGSRGFWTFYRQYTHTGIHAATTAALTAFGLLTVVHRGFVALAIGVYVIPPLYLYFVAENAAGIDEPDESGTAEGDETTDAESDASAGPDRSGSATGSGTIAASATDTTRSTPEPGDDEPATGTTAGTARQDADREWLESESPTDEELTDVVGTADGPYAVGEGGTVLARGEDGWETVLERGPTTESNDLRGTDASADGRHLWFAGDSGVLARYDVAASRLTDYSAPLDITNSWTDVAAVGPAGEERLYLVDGSGQVLRGTHDGSECAWNDPVIPGSGSSMTAVAFAADAGFLCDTNAGVYRTTDGGESYEVVGIEGAGADFTDVAPVDRETATVACDDGTVFRYDGRGWTNLYLGDEDLYAIDRRGTAGLAVGDDGTIHARDADGWEREPTPVETALYGAALLEKGTAVAVGEDARIVERR